jgi:uncharacterized glyoxalase superfamily protein PhnB
MDKNTNRSRPPGTIIVELVYEDVATAVSWLCQTFGFRERLRIGQHRSQLVLGEAAIVVMAPGSGQAAPGSLESQKLTHSIMVHVTDVDQHYERVKQLGVRIIGGPATHPYGERQYTVEDPDGHRWTFSQSVADVDPGDWGGLLREEKNPA